MKQSTLPPGTTAKSQTPRKAPLSTGKPDKSSANAKLKLDEQLPKGDTKKQPEVPKVDTLPKKSGEKGKDKPAPPVTLYQEAKAFVRQDMFEPADPADPVTLNFYNPVPDFESMDAGNDAKEEGNEAEGNKGLKRKSPSVLMLRWLRP